MASEYHRGDMDIHEQQNTFHAFGAFTKWGSLGLAALLLFLTMFFCTDANFITSAGVSVVLLVVGILVLKEKKGGGH
ncbi:MAG: aa3-type cytochrome c oxidase subunit [Caulobacter sp.]|jgi:hypothetical protein|nr:aa3-type cytochrome c oxidase subunit [Caulobacter sp.]